ncbi:MAG TPA: hypothetical protein VM425_17330 [Myxococcota bacterium]|nr:hypothetical protein [Myxococcota bacterium]
MPRKKKAIKKAKQAPVKEGKKTGKRYSDKRKQALLARYNKLRKGGKNTTDAAKAVGVPYITLHNWEKKSGGAEKSVKKTNAKKTLKKAMKIPRGKKKAARLAKKAATGKLVLVTPTGFRIEGISSGELIKVLKALK